MDVGDAWDFFIVHYDYSKGVQVDFSSAQFTKAYRDLCVRVYGSAGTADSHYGGAVNITGDHAWAGTPKDDTRSGSITNTKDFIESIRTGKYINNADSAVESNLTAILGRMAAYRRMRVTWQEMMQHNDKLDAKFTL